MRTARCAQHCMHAICKQRALAMGVVAREHLNEAAVLQTGD